MSDTRRVTTVLNKVEESILVSDRLWKKVQETDNLNLKEEYWSDMKKNITKLKNLRRKMKSCLQSKILTETDKRILKEIKRFRNLEKESKKTKPFSSKGLEEQPMDPKEKGKTESRDWLNNTVSELESQIESFEAEMEGLSVKKGKTRPPRLSHLKSSITRHKDHIEKLELMLRLLDNDELSPEQVNDVKDVLDDYVARNQVDFDDFADVDLLYKALPLEKGDVYTGAAPSNISPLHRSKALKNLVTIRQNLDKEGVVGSATSLKSPLFSRSKDQQDVVASGRNIVQPLISSSLRIIDHPKDVVSGSSIGGRMAGRVLFPPPPSGLVGLITTPSPQQQQPTSNHFLLSGSKDTGGGTEPGLTEDPQQLSNGSKASESQRHLAETTPVCSPQEHVPVVDISGLDTLFKNFHFPKNSYHKDFAATQLKEKSWKYHESKNQWFYLIKEQQTVVDHDDDDYEEGTYMFFDHQLWCERTGDFKFHSKDFEV